MKNTITKALIALLLAFTGVAKAQTFKFAPLGTTLGMKVMAVPLEGESGSKIVMLGDIPSGVYSYVVRCGDIILDGKLVIVR